MNHDLGRESKARRLGLLHLRQIDGISCGFTGAYRPEELDWRTRQIKVGKEAALGELAVFDGREGRRIAGRRCIRHLFERLRRHQRREVFVEVLRHRIRIHRYVRIFVRVSLEVHLEVAFSREATAAHVALVGPFAGVRPDVNLERGVAAENLAAVATAMLEQR